MWDHQCLFSPYIHQYNTRCIAYSSIWASIMLRLVLSHIYTCALPYSHVHLLYSGHIIMTPAVHETSRKFEQGIKVSQPLHDLVFFYIFLIGSQGKNYEWGSKLCKICKHRLFSSIAILTKLFACVICCLEFYPLHVTALPSYISCCHFVCIIEACFS